MQAFIALFVHISKLAKREGEKEIDPKLLMDKKRERQG